MLSTFRLTCGFVG